MLYKVLALLFIWFSLTFNVLGQKQANVWYFGKHGGLDFNSGMPEVLTDGAIDNFEGVTSISNSNGVLQFYSDGITVYNHQHQVMDNGTDLLGHPSSTQSGVIIPLPQSVNKYLIFTVDYAYSDGYLYYSIVDMNKNGGLGAVTSKNIYLQSNSAEKISAVIHQNGQDIWVVIHERGNSKYLSYLVTKDGVSPNVVVSDTGPNLEDGVQGYLKFSPDGRLLAMATYHLKRVDLCTFDRQTGIVTFSFKVTYPDATYGVEFSEDGRFLYATVSFDLKRIYQIDIATQNNKLIASPTMAPGALQLGPDGKIYVARYDRPDVASKYLGVIQSPELEGTACNYIDEAIYLGTGNSLMGLPTFIQSYFSDYSIQLEATPACQGDIALFNAIISPELVPIIDWVRWDFGDPSSPLNHSNEILTSHVYQSAGIYNITLTISAGNDIITRNTQVEIFPIPAIGLSDTTGICPGKSAIIDAGGSDFSYLWSTNETTHSIEVSTTGTYSVTKTSNEGCSGTDMIWVKEFDLPPLILPDTVGFCPGESASIDAGSGNYSYLWNTNETSHSIEVSSVGAFSIRKTSSEGCIVSDEIWAKEFFLPLLDLGEDQMLCDVEYILISADGFENYLWHDGSTSNQIKAYNPGAYSLTASTIDNCLVSDEVQIFECCAFSLFVPNAFTPNTDGINDEFKPILEGVFKYQMTIANRWGAILFTTNDINQGWNGKFKESLCSEGVYFVILDYERCSFEGIPKKDKYYGSVTLLFSKH